MEMTQEATRIASQQAAVRAAADPAGARAPVCELLSFHLGAEEYGIDILKVQEIRSYEPPTRIASSPRFVKGVVNLRGVIVPIVDLRLKFALEAAEYGDLTVVIVLNLMGRIIGVVVDSVSDVVQLGAEQIKAAPAIGGSVDAECITGIASIHGDDRERLLILLDIERLMSSADMGLADTPSGY
jgi:purine-binding chemotaxis protein CheW